MSIRPVRLLAYGVVLVAAVGASAVVTANAVSSSSAAVRACETTRGLLALPSSSGHCAKGQRGVVINQQGPRGLTGRTGPIGKTGLTGKTGPAGSLRSTPFYVTFDHTSNADNEITTAEGITIDLECGDTSISTLKATIAIIATEGHGHYVVTSHPATGSPTTTDTDVDFTSSDRSSRALVGDLGSYATVRFDGIALAPDGDFDNLDIWFSRDTRQGHPVCTFEGTIVDTGKARQSTGR